VIYKAEITNTAEYLETKYKEDQFVHIVKRHESNRPNMNLAIQTTTNFVEELKSIKRER
jgi:hypothetical protein